MLFVRDVLFMMMWRLGGSTSIWNIGNFCQTARCHIPNDMLTALVMSDVRHSLYIIHCMYCNYVMRHSKELVHTSDLATISLLCIYVYCCIDSHLYCACCRHHNQDWMCSRIFWNIIHISCTLHVLLRLCSCTGNSWSSTTYCQIRQVILWIEIIVLHLLDHSLK